MLRPKCLTLCFLLCLFWTFSDGAFYGQYPMVAELHDLVYKEHYCGAFLISERYVLTAAHCLTCTCHEECRYMFEILIGDIFLDGFSSKAKSRQLTRIAYCTKHSLYNQATLEYDIAIIKLIKDAKTSKNVQPVRMAEAESRVEAKCETIGWNGRRSATQAVKATRTKILNETACANRFKVYSSQVMLCAEDVRYQRGVCSGDAGNPLLCDDVAVGIVSFGRECSLPGKAAVYVDLLRFNNWTLDQVQLLNAKPPVILRPSKGCMVPSGYRAMVLAACIFDLLSEQFHVRR